MFAKKSIIHVFSVLIVLVSMLVFEDGSSASAKNYPQELNKGLQKSNQCLGAGGETAYHTLTGKVRFVGTKPDKPIQQSVENLRFASPESAARGYLSKCGSIFGLSDQAAELVVKRQNKTEDGRSVIRFQQNYQGIPILGGELVVQLNSANDIILVNGDILPRIRLSVKAGIDASVAQQTALQMVADQYGIGSEALKVSEAQLRIYSPALIQARAGTAALVWQMEVTPVELAPIREFVLIDAQLGTVALNFNQVDTAKNRLTYTANNTQTQPGTLVCNESNPTCSGGDTDAVNAHVYAGDTYDFFFNTHGRDSINNAGMSLISTVHYNIDYCNAFWDGFQMTYGDGCFIVTDDVVAHELTHGVTQYESGLFYSYESGAINESFSDIWGEFVDLTNGADLPADRWLMGEDTSIGAIRNMKDPTAKGDPDRMDSPYFYHGSGDNGGVHINSGVGNKAAYLITDGDTFNGYTVTGLGITKAAKIYYEAQTNILTSTSNYYSLYNALNQACTNLIDTSGITAADCTEVQSATLATEMDHYPPPLPPDNDDINTPVEISNLPYTNTQATGGATTAAGDPVFACTSAKHSNSVWYSYTPDSSQTLTIDTFGSNYDTVLAVWTGSPGSLVSGACNDDYAYPTNVQSQVTVDVTAGTYYIEVASYAGGGGTLTLNITSTATPIISGNAGVADATLSYTDGTPKIATANGSGLYSFAVSSGWSGTVTPSKSGYTFSPVNQLYTNVLANQTAQDYIATATGTTNLLQDPSFEAFTPNPYWSEYSSNFGTPLCTTACGTGGGTAGPRTGSVWGWFGGIQANETGSLSQTVTILSGSPANLEFYLWIGSATAGSDTADVFTAKIDGVTVFSANATQIGSYSTYTLVSVDLSAYADNASHTITFSSVTTGQIVTFNLDDVSLGGLPLSTATYKSTSTQDGWILESTKTSGVGGTKNNTATTLRLGDDAANKQYRAILSFDTSTLPEGAVITSVMLKFKYAGKTGTLPFGTHGNLLVDIRNGTFSNNPALQLADFKATASKAKALTYTKVDNWYSKSLNPLDFSYVNLLGVTQFRLRFSKDDNNDFGADLLKIFSGNAINEADRPQLVIEYYVP